MQLDDQKIGEILLKENYIAEKDLKEALELSGKNEKSLTDILLSSGILTKGILGQAFGEYFGVPFVDLKKVKIDNSALNQVPELVARSRGVIAFERTENGVKIGMTNPGDIEIKNMLGKKFGQNVLPYYITEADLGHGLSGYKASLKDEFAEILKRLEDKDLTRDKRDEETMKMVDTLIVYGYQSKASDIHIEPYLKTLMIRFRVDGVMHDVLDVPKEFAELILSRIKILSKMRTDEHHAAQDGKIRFDVGDEKIDIRVSIVPVTQGENVVMRLLSSKSRKFDLGSLGLTGRNFEVVNRAIKNPHGMILVTGPTGSGKTTTLYAILKILNKREVNIATIEDPVEYDVEGISQIQVNTKTELTFAKGLRSIVRQDPDIIMVGEIRDEETAGIATNSAMTGHLVLSTLHTNDAATSLPRLLDMGVEPFLVASTVNIAIAQRLVRKICPSCRVSYKLSEDEIRIADENPSILQVAKEKGHEHLHDARFYKGNGCKLCGDTGYAGRIGIFEILEMSEDIKDLILKNASSDEIVVAARKNGMTSMFEDGISKVFEGFTTFEEVMRVSRE